MDVFTGLLHDAPAHADLDAHRAVGRRTYGWAVGPLVVPDDRLGTLTPAGTTTDVAVSVVSGTGAGGLLALDRRRVGVRVAAVETVLRDLDDLPGNAARVVSAAAALPSGTDVYVEVPGGPGLVEAVETVEAAGLMGRVDLRAVALDRHGYSAAERLSVLIEADLPFKVTGTSVDAFGPYGAAAVLMTVEALVDGADPDEAGALLGTDDQARMVGGLTRWDAATESRVQRRLRGIDCPDLVRTLDQLVAAGLLEPGD